LDPRQDNKAREIIIPREGYVLKGRHFYLGHSAEEIGSDHYVPMLHCKSGIARLGLFIHVTADLIDIGSHGNLTLQPASDS
jgi:dCTP deaminase